MNIDFSQLSDRDIDALVLQRIYGNHANDKDIMRAWLRGGFKYTTHWSDAGPIVIAHKIALIPEVGDGTWWAMIQPVIQSNWRVDADGKAIVNDSNPLRAAMLVFLEMHK